MSSHALVALAIETLGAASQRTPRTHIHKLLYLAEKWGNLPSPHQFSLYLHGPYSREIDAEIQSLRAVGLVTAVPDPAGFGADYKVDVEYAKRAEQNGGLTSQQLSALRGLAQELGRQTVRHLEALTTCEFVESKQGSDSVEGAVKRLKPHLSNEEIVAARKQLACLRDGFESRLSRSS